MVTWPALVVYFVRGFVARLPKCVKIQLSWKAAWMLSTRWRNVWVQYHTLSSLTPLRPLQGGDSPDRDDCACGYVQSHVRTRHTHGCIDHPVARQTAAPWPARSSTPSITASSAYAKTSLRSSMLAAHSRCGWTDGAQPSPLPRPIHPIELPAHTSLTVACDCY